MKTMKPRNWDKFQHYKNRCPPWIKLHRDILDDFDFASLPIASKALAPLLWLLASDSKDGELPADPARIAHRLRWSLPDVVAGLSPLIDKGFMLSDSIVLAECKQLATPEGETEGETEGEESASSPSKKSRKSKAKGVTIEGWIAGLADDDPAVSADDPIFQWATDTGLPAKWIHIAWWMFEARYTESGKTYIDWRAVFRKAVREDWLKVWRHDSRQGRFVLTTAGELARLEMEATA